MNKNKIDILFSLALLLGKMTPKQIAKAKTFDDVPTDIQNVALALYAQHKDDLDLLASKEDLSQVDIQTKMSEIGKKSGSEVFVIANPGDLKTCEKCRKWIGKKVSDTDRHYPSIKEWMDSGGLHINCRCSLHSVEEAEVAIEKANDYLERKKKRLEELAKWNAAFNTQATSQLIFN